MWSLSLLFLALTNAYSVRCAASRSRFVRVRTSSIEFVQLPAIGNVRLTLQNSGLSSSAILWIECSHPGPGVRLSFCATYHLEENVRNQLRPIEISRARAFSNSQRSF